MREEYASPNCLVIVGFNGRFTNFPCWPRSKRPGRIEYPSSCSTMEREENKGSLVPHPMRERSAAYRYRYCFGLGVLAMGNMRAITELQPYYERLLRQLLPDQDQYAQIITDINNDLERHLTV